MSERDRRGSGVLSEDELRRLALLASTDEEVHAVLVRYRALRALRDTLRPTGLWLLVGPQLEVLLAEAELELLRHVQGEGRMNLGEVVRGG